MTESINNRFIRSMELLPMSWRWSHATNCLSTLQQAMAVDDVDFIEADVCYAEDVGPFMAHSPLSPAELSLGRWLIHFEKTRDPRRMLRTGCKLDFKMSEAVAPAIDQLIQVATAPVWLNADIFQGPRGAPSKFDPVAFVNQCRRVPGAVLSLGWTTGPIGESVGYTDAMIESMLKLCRSCRLQQSAVTFPVRAVDALASLSSLTKLLSHSAKWSLTVWHGLEGVDAAEEGLLRGFDPARTYLDLQRVHRASDE